MTKKKHESYEETTPQDAQGQPTVEEAAPQTAETPVEAQDTTATGGGEPSGAAAPETVEVSAGEVEALKNELAQARLKTDEYLDGWQRSRAEFANYKRRVERDQAQIYQTTSGNIIKRYLDIADDLDRALKNRPESGEGAAWAQGIELIYRKLLSILEAEGVKPIEAEGQIFNPTQHEAISQEEAPGFESGQVIEVVNPGYVLGDRVLRPALVRVAR